MLNNVFDLNKIQVLPFFMHMSQILQYYRDQIARDLAKAATAVQLCDQ